MTSPERPRPAWGRVRRRATGAVAALATLVGVVALGEAGARHLLRDLPPPGARHYTPQMRCGQHDPDLGWRLRPGARSTIPPYGDVEGYTIAINSRGLRDDEHPYARTEGVARVLLLGDSVAFAYGLPVEQGLAHLLEERLGPGVEVVNAAVPGWSTDQQQWWLEAEGRRYEPDVVLLVFVVNDVPGNASLHMHGMDKPRWTRGPEGAWRVEGRPVPEEPARFRTPPEGLLGWLVRRSALVRLASGQGRPVVLAPAAERDGLSEEPSTATARQTTTHALRELRRTCAEMGARLAVVYVPHLQDMGLLSPTYPPPPDDGTETLTPLSRYLAGAGEPYGFRALSVDRALLAAVQRGEELMLRPDGHLNTRGNEVVAEALAGQLEPLLPDPPGR